ncbi:hypothetical protein BH11MYX3_BH11MYX3_18360 [soil metagenome]
MITRGIAAIAGVVLAVAAPAARADTDVERADKLFDEGRALMKTDLHAACEKFDESLKLNSQAIGVLLNVALCDEKLGRTASAVAKFTEARDRARESHMDVHLKAAEERLAELTPKVPHVTIRFATPPLPGTRIVIDERVIAMTEIADVPIDPGEHPLVVSAPDRLPYQVTVKIADGERREIEVPALETAIRSSRRTIGKVVAISGGAALGVGIVIGVFANRRYERQFDQGHCDRDTRHCDGIGQPETEKARTLGTVGTVIGGIGVAAAAVGVYLWVRTPKEARAGQISVLPQLDRAGASVVAVGRF